MRPNIWQIQYYKHEKQRQGMPSSVTPHVEILIDKKTPEDITNASKAVGEHLAQSALTTELFVLNVAKVVEEQIRHYIGRNQFPLIVQDSKPHKGVPDFVSKEDLVRKIEILQNTIRKIPKRKNYKKNATTQKATFKTQNNMPNSETQKK